MNYHNFINAQEMAKRYPDTFEAPSLKELSEIKQNDFIKVCLNDERFWVHVIEVDEDEIRGKVDNNLFESQPFNMDDIIACKKEHVYSITKENEWE